MIEKFSLGCFTTIVVDKRLRQQLDKNNKEESNDPDGGAARRAGLRAVVTKALAGGLAAYLCASERGTVDHIDSKNRNR